MTSLTLIERLLLLFSDGWLYQLCPPLLRRQGEPDGLPLLRPQPHRGPLGLHHLPQVGPPALPLPAQLPLRQTGGEEHGTLRPVFASGQPRTVQPSQQDGPDRLVSQFTSVTLQMRSLLPVEAAQH